MLRVVLADDENKILLLLQKLIDWKGLGYEIVGTANAFGRTTIGGAGNTGNLVWGKLAGESAAKYALGLE